MSGLPEVLQSPCGPSRLCPVSVEQKQQSFPGREGGRNVKAPLPQEGEGWAGGSRPAGLTRGGRGALQFAGKWHILALASTDAMLQSLKDVITTPAVRIVALPNGNLEIEIYYFL